MAAKNAAPKCAKCGKNVHEKAMIAEGKVFHTYHFQCITCNKVLPSEYASHDGQIYCLECHKKKVQTPCAKCNQNIKEAACFEANGRRYHPNCLRCATCNQVLSDGVFYPINNEVYCLTHFWSAQQKAKTPAK